jgi:hypothetical protein
MVLDVMPADDKHTWLATEKGKLAYFRARRLWNQTDNHKSFPRLAFGEGAARVFRYFPDKLPIGMERGTGGRMHLFVYLVRHERPDEFRLFLARHAELLRGLDEWTIRIVLPRRFQKAKSLHTWALPDDLLTPVNHGLVDELECRRAGGESQASKRQRPPRHFSLHRGRAARSVLRRQVHALVRLLTRAPHQAACRRTRGALWRRGSGKDERKMKQTVMRTAAALLASDLPRSQHAITAASDSSCQTISIRYVRDPLALSLVSRSRARRFPSIFRGEATRS